MTHIQEPYMGLKLSPQQKLVYDYLMTGRTLSTMIAITSLSIGDVRTRIAELRKLGIAIKDKWAKDFGEGKYKQYFIEDAVEARRSSEEKAS